ncbi:hypothetical protein F4861DRAFT_50974 [Xylaria intraflava]|nr:hypothetical protein F4861DRAFT_50974 [Xylaria intraflava]
MTETPVLCFPISGERDGFFLLQASSNGSRPLDLKLIASESTAVFLAKIRHKKIDECKASPAHCTDEEWQQILISTLVDLKPLPDIEVRADVQSDRTSVALSFRKNIQGITQRLGSIRLDENDKAEVSLFDWCVSAIASRTRVTEELADAFTKAESLKNSVSELKAQLENFITTKEEDETQLLEKFQDLLNEKKLKIRQQQRLLDAAKADPEKIANLGSGGDDDTHRNAGPSRSRKRKVLVKEEDDDESDDGFERMNIDKPDVSDDASTHNQPESGSDTDDDHDLAADNDATASDSDTDDYPPRQAELEKRKVEPASSRITKPATARRNQTAKPSHNTRATKQKQGAVASDSQDEDEAPPPPRTLPFTRNRKAAPPQKPADDDETQSDDDSEL